jgi:two-component system phosphate regulon response regulator OmpR
MMKSVLIVDDDKRLLHLITSLLKVNGYNATGAQSAAEAKELLKSGNFDVLIVDWMMPNTSGIEFIKSIRSSQSSVNSIPAMMLTALGDVDSKVTGFDAGFDDYLTKPFEEKELIARINAIMARSQHTCNDTLKLGDCEFNKQSGELRRGKTRVYLSTVEMTLLLTLCQKPNHPCTREELVKRLAFCVSERTIDVQIARLRQKLGDDAKEPLIIKTVRHIGYSVYIPT